MSSRTSLTITSTATLLLLQSPLLKGVERVVSYSQIIPLMSPRRTVLCSWHRSLWHAFKKFTCRHLRQQASSKYPALKTYSKITPMNFHAWEQQDRMYSASLHKTQVTAGNQQKWIAEMAQKNADVTHVHSHCTGQVSLILNLAFLDVCKTSQFALFYWDLKKELVFLKPMFLPNIRIYKKNQEYSRFTVALLSNILKKNRKCNGELEKACNYVHKHLLKKTAQAQLICFKI